MAQKLFGLFQFTHPGGVRLFSHVYAPRRHSVSIHAPGRGATHISHHTPPMQKSFNSRTREGCDAVGLLDDRHTFAVSIHAPGRGATQPYSSALFLTLGFNSRTREGCDLQLAVGLIEAGVSIHAPGRGATGQKSANAAALQSFNSRTREGCDCASMWHGLQSARFNSRTREGCD